jgi:hypothetical protein
MLCNGTSLQLRFNLLTSRVYYATIIVNFKGQPYISASSATLGIVLHDVDIRIKPEFLCSKSSIVSVNKSIVTHAKSLLYSYTHLKGLNQYNFMLVIAWVDGVIARHSVECTSWTMSSIEETTLVSGIQLTSGIVKVREKDTRELLAE